MPSSSDVTLESLGQEVQNLSLKVAEYLKQGSIPAPSFQENSPAFYPKEAECQIARLELLSKLQDLTALALGPGEYLTAQVVYVSLVLFFYFCFFFLLYGTRSQNNQIN